MTKLVHEFSSFYKKNFYIKNITTVTTVTMSLLSPSDTLELLQRLLFHKPLRPMDRRTHGPTDIQLDFQSS